MSDRSTNQRPGTTWWGEIPFAIGQTRFWRIGSCEIAATRQAQDWRIAHRQTDAELETGTADSLLEEGFSEPLDNWSRFLSAATDDHIRLAPRTLDRPLISRPEHPFQLRPKQEVTIYVSSPVSVAFDTDGEPLIEFPAVRLSNTWFGPSTLEGELCYAAKTSARTELGLVRRHNHRVTTALKIVNRAPEPLLVEKISIPLPLLGIYDAGGDLWTNQLSMVRDADDEFAELRIGRTPPNEAGECVQLAKPRSKSERNVLIRAFGSLFSDGVR